MQGLSRILAILAAIMFVIGGAPSSAAARTCDPCPADCPMMKQMASAAAAHPGQPADHGRQSDNPCKQGVACQINIAAPAPPEASEPVTLTALPVILRPADPSPVRSRPPDRSLRPPIQL